MNHGTTLLLKFFSPIVVYLICALLPGTLWAAEGAAMQPGKITPRMQSVIATHTLRIKEWAASPLLIDAVRKHNLQNTGLEEIQRINSDWINGRADNLAATLLTNPAGSFLHEKINKNDMLYTEAFLCDSKGAVVGEYPKTTDYWQGDEDKFTQSFNDGKGRDYIGALEFDESTQTYSVQVSVPVQDDGKTIGVLVVGLKNI